MNALGRPHTNPWAAASLSVYNHGAHVVAWTPAGETDVLYLSPTARFDTSDAIRGGVPVIFPWFGSGVSGDITAPHGFARTAQWHLVEAHSHQSEVTVRFTLSSSDVITVEWSHSYEAVLEIRAGRELVLELTITNTGDSPFTFEEALHAYLRVGDSAKVTIDGLAGADYFDKVAQSACRQVGPVEFVGETDRVYTSTTDVVIHDPILQRDVRVTKRDSASTIVWNPWAEKAQTMVDLPDDGWQSFVCVEGGNVGAAAVSLRPGETHTLGYSLSVER